MPPGMVCCKKKKHLCLSTDRKTRNCRKPRLPSAQTPFSAGLQTRVLIASITRNSFIAAFSFQSISVWGLIVLVYYFYWVSPRSAWFEAKLRNCPESAKCWLCDLVTDVIPLRALFPPAQNVSTESGVWTVALEL